MVSPVCKAKCYKLKAHLELLQLLQGTEHHRILRVLFTHMYTCAQKQALKSSTCDVRSQDSGQKNHLTG